MRSTLQSLKEYQDVLVRIDELDRLLSFVPPEIEELEKEWKSIHERIKELSVKKQEQEEKIKEQELLLTEAGGRSQKFEKDLHEVTNTKEYHAVLKEIDTVKKQVHALSEDIAQRKADLNEIERNMEECIGLEKESKAKYEKEKSEYDDKQVVNKTERDKKLKQKKTFANKVPPKLMKQFERIAARRNGVGLALCISAVCQACNVRVRPSVVDQLRRHERLITCDSCKRLLFFADMED